MSTYGDQLWSWLAESFQKLKDDHRSDPDRDWERLVSEMWSRLGVSAANDDPVIEEMVGLVADLLRRNCQDRTATERADYLAGTDVDRDVLDQIEQAVTRYGSQPVDDPGEPAPTEVASTETGPAGVASEQPAKGPGEVSDDIVRELALPVLRELAKKRPDLVARHSTDELLARLGQVIAHRLAGR
ncbi:MAG TPA: hypothetical protein VGG05_07340 [Pseudonocardiaceae bacterium]